MELLEFLQSKGFSRRNALGAMQSNAVFINQTPISYRKHILSPGDTIDLTLPGTEKKSFTFTVQEKTKKQIILFHKPTGYTVSDFDQHNKTIYDLLPQSRKNTYYFIGRLDKESSGLLILTNDRKLVHTFGHPSHNHKKIYHIQTSPQVTQHDLELGKKGVSYYDQDLHSQIILSWNNARFINTNTVEVTLSSGKKRHIRRLCESLGKVVTYLHRVQFAERKLGNLKPGEWEKIDIA